MFPPVWIQLLAPYSQVQFNQSYTISIRIKADPTSVLKPRRDTEASLINLRELLRHSIYEYLMYLNTNDKAI